MKNKTIAVAVLGILVVAFGVFLLREPKQPDSPASSPSNIKQIIADLGTGQLKAASASITSQELKIKQDNDSITTYALPKDEFFVSIAPYLTDTHPCAIHSLTSCSGEMANKSFNVHIENSSGQVVINKKMTAGANGFIDIWLPRDQTFKVKIEHEGKSATTQLATAADSDTCISTMQLT